MMRRFRFETQADASSIIHVECCAAGCDSAHTSPAQPRAPRTSKFDNAFVQGQDVPLIKTPTFTEFDT